MIYEGQEGSVNGYYKNKLIVSRPLGNKRTLENYKKESMRVLIEAMREGNHISQIKLLCLQTLKMFRYHDTKKEPDIEERDFLLFALLMLIKLGVVEEDGDREGLLIMGRKKPTKPTKGTH